MSIRTIIVSVCIVVASFLGAVLLMNLLWPSPVQQPQPSLAAAPPTTPPLPPLQPLTGTSTVLAPAAIAISAIRDALEAQTPHNLSGKAQNPVAKLLQNANLTINVTRGALGVFGQPNALVVTAPLNGTFEVLGTLSAGANALGGALGNVVGGGLGQQLQNLAGKAFDQRVQIQGAVTATARPTIATNWRLIPNLTAQADVADVALPVAGVKLSVANEVKPFVDNAVREQTSALETRLRNDPFIENAARSEWTKLCRAIPLGAAAVAGQGMPNLWLEIRPTRAVAAQPKIATDALVLLIGVEAQTRIVPNETKPDCPFPQTLDIVPQADAGTLGIAVPIDIPFTEVSRLLDAQLAGKTFPEDGSGEFATTVKQAAVAAAGDRLLISLLVNVKKRGLFSVFGADATVQVRGRPVLDQDQQILRFTDVALDVSSNAGFGAAGEAAQAAAPLLRKTLAAKAVIDLKPFAADAKKRIAAAVGGFTTQGGGVRGTVTVDDLRLADIAYDATTLRVIAIAGGTVNVAISSLTMQ